MVRSAKQKANDKRLGQMAKKRSSRSYRSERRTRRARAKDVLGKIKWGEAALMAAAGYFTGAAIQKSGIGPYLFNKVPQFYDYVEFTGLDSGDAASKGIGAIVGADALYDIFSGKGVDKALSIKLPYAAGALYDTPMKNSGNTTGRW